MPSPDQIEKEIDHVFFNLLGLDQEDEEDSIFVRVLRYIASKQRIDGTSLFPCEDFRSTCFNLHMRLFVEVRSLQFYLKHLQEKGFFYSMIVSTILPSMSQTSESFSTTRIPFGTLVVEWTLNPSHRLQESSF